MAARRRFSRFLVQAMWSGYIRQPARTTRPDQDRPSAADLIRLFQLEPHPEGGFFREVYRASGSRYGADASDSVGTTNRSLTTSIYFLLCEGSHSTFHRLRSDEIWHFYLGGPLTLVQISPQGELADQFLGQNVQAGQKVQHVVPAEFWQAAFPSPGSRFCFVGCTVSPGFDYRDFELGNRVDLIKRYPHARRVIEKLTPG